MTSLIQQLWELAAQELDRLPLEPFSERRLILEDVPRAGPKRAVVEEVDLRVERPEAGPAALGLRHELLFYIPNTPSPCEKAGGTMSPFAGASSRPGS